MQAGRFEIAREILGRNILDGLVMHGSRRMWNGSGSYPGTGLDRSGSNISRNEASAFKCLIVKAMAWSQPSRRRLCTELREAWKSGRPVQKTNSKQNIPMSPRCIERQAFIQLHMCHDTV